MTKYVTMQRPRRRLSFWQRTLMVFLLALIVMLVVFAVLYSRSFSVNGSDNGSDNGLDSATNAIVTDPEQMPISTVVTSTRAVAMDTDASATTVLERSSDLFGASDTAADTVTPNVSNTPSTSDMAVTAASPTNNGEAVAALEERPELLRDLRLSEQALAENEPRVAMELLLGLTRDHTTFRPDEVVQRLYESYLALGDQAMRREARSEAVSYYDLAGELTVPDRTQLLRRRTAIARLFPNLQAATLSQTQVTAAEPTATVAQAAPVAAPAQNLPAPAATPTQTPVPPVQIQVAPPRCPDNHIALTAPAVNTVVSGTAVLMGSVRLEEGWYYKVEWAAAGSDEFAYVDGSENAIEGAVIGLFDTTLVPNGNYVLRVTTVDQTGNYPPPCEVPIVVRN